MRRASAARLALLFAMFVPVRVTQPQTLLADPEPRHYARASGPWRSPRVPDQAYQLFIAPAPSRQRSHVGVGRIVAQLLLGVAGAWAGGYAGYELGSLSADDWTVSGDAGYSPAGNRGYVIGSTIGSALAAYMVGSDGPATGSYWITLAGATTASLVLLPQLDDPYMPVYGVVLVAPLQAIGSALGFHASRR